MQHFEGRNRVKLQLKGRYCSIPEQFKCYNNQEFRRMLGEGESKVVLDRYFFEAFKKVEERMTKTVSCFILRGVALIFAIPINHILLQEHRVENISLFTIFLLSALAYNLLENLLVTYLFCTRFRNKGRVIKIAQGFHHTLLLHDLKSLDSENSEDQFNLYEVEQNLNLRVSTIYYDFENMEKVNDVSEEFKAMRERNGETLIRGALEADLACFKFYNAFLQLVSICIMAFGFYVSSLGQINDPQHTLLEFFLISEVILKPKIFAFLLIICLIPVFIVVLCAYLCCCKKKEPKAKLPMKVKATPEIISKCSECSICFQMFSASEDIVVLPCSELHVFHHTCIDGWTKIKPNCPICRAELCE